MRGKDTIILLQPHPDPVHEKILLYGNSILITGLACRLQEAGFWEVQRVEDGPLGELEGVEMVAYDVSEPASAKALSRLREATGPVLIGLDAHIDTVTVLDEDKLPKKSSEDALGPKTPLKVQTSQASPIFGKGKWNMKALRSLSILFILLCLLAGMLSFTPARVVQVSSETGTPAGLNAAGWAQIDSLLSQRAYLKASNTGASDEFGYSVAVSGDTVVVGAYNEDSSASGMNGDQNDNSAVNSGAPYVFTRSRITWSQEAYLLT